MIGEGGRGQAERKQKQRQENVLRHQRSIGKNIGLRRISSNPQHGTIRELDHLVGELNYVTDLHHCSPSQVSQGS